MHFVPDNLFLFPSPRKVNGNGHATVEPVQSALGHTAVEVDDGKTVLETDSGNPILMDQ